MPSIFALSHFVYLLDFINKALGSARNGQNYVILSETVFDEIQEVAVGLIDLVDLFDSLGVLL